MKIKVSEATPRQLDWLVAKCEGLNPNTDPEVRKQYVGYNGFAEANGFGYAIKNYSTNWSQAGPIIEREGIEVRKGNPLYFPKGNEKGDYYEPLWIAGRHHGQTLLIAAMCCYVASKLGDEVEVPDELI